MFSDRVMDISQLHDDYLSKREKCHNAHISKMRKLQDYYVKRFKELTTGKKETDVVDTPTKPELKPKKQVASSVASKTPSVHQGKFKHVKIDDTAANLPI